jgi:GntR family transcriptional regulator / MocR family aminotransferase
MHLDLDGDGPQYLQLSRAIRSAVQQGRLASGTRLPPTRELAQTLGLARNTVRSAYEHLGAQGLLDSRVGAGTFINGVSHGPGVPSGNGSLLDGATPAPSAYARRARELLREFPVWRRHQGVRYSLQYGEPFADALLPEQWRNALSRAALYTPMGYPAMAGLPALREAVCQYLRSRRAVDATLDEGDTAVVEDPGYFSARHTFVAHGARLVGVPVDKSGLVVDELPERRPGLVFTTPSHQFPLGAVMSQRRRQELLRYAARHDSWIVEDDYDAELRYDSRQVAALKAMDRQGRVIFVGSFSKVLAPSMRLAYMVLPPALREDFVTAKRLMDLGCPAIEQAALAYFMETGAFERHLRRAVRALRARRNALFAAMQQHGADWLDLHDSHAGMHVIGRLKGRAATKQQELIESARLRGVGVYTLAQHYIRPPAQPGLLFGFAALSPGEIEVAARLLGRAASEL